MKKLLFFSSIFMLFSFFAIAQDTDLTDRVNIEQNNQKFMGVFSYAYQDLQPNGFSLFQLHNYGGTPTAPLATPGSRILGAFMFSGYDGTAKRQLAELRVSTLAGLTPTNTPIRMDFIAGPDRLKRMSILGDSGDVGIGTSTPSRDLEVFRSGESSVIGISTDSESNGAGIELTTNEVANDNFIIRKNGSTASGTTAGGVSLADLTTLRTGAASGPLMMGTISSNPVYFTSDNEVAMYIADDQDIGVNTQSPGAQLHVEGDDDNDDYIIRAESNYVANSDVRAVYGSAVSNPGYGYGGEFRGGFRGVYGLAVGTTYSGTARGVYGSATGTAGSRYGVYGQGSGTTGTTANYGVYGTASGSGATTNYGVYGTASNGGTNWAGYFDGNTKVTDTLTIDHMAGIGGADNPDTDLHIKQSQQTITGGTGGIKFEESGNTSFWRTYHSGSFLSFNLEANRVAYISTTGAWVETSDRRLKKNINDMEPVLERVLELRPVKYLYKRQNDSESKTIGFIAQEAKEHFPEIVVTGEDGKMGMTYAHTGVIAIKAIQELNGVVEEKDEVIEELTNKVALLEDKLDKIENLDLLLSQIDAVEEKLDKLEALDTRINNIEADLQSCCLNSNAEEKNGAVTTIELNGNEDQAVLQQNAPNPFSQQTLINYYIPSSATKGSMVITDTRGAILKTVSFSETGFGSVVIKAGELSPGTYAYTLFVDGVRVETKQMVLVR